jgi:hypothetical protein
MDMYFGLATCMMDMYSMSNLCEYPCITIVLYSEYLNSGD